MKQKSNSLLGRQREVEAITAKIEEMEQKTLVLEQDVKDKKSQIEELQREINKQQQAFVERLKDKEQESDQEGKQIGIRRKSSE